MVVGHLARLSVGHLAGWSQNLSMRWWLRCCFWWLVSTVSNCWSFGVGCLFGWWVAKDVVCQGERLIGRRVGRLVVGWLVIGSWLLVGWVGLFGLGGLP